MANWLRQLICVFRFSSFSLTTGSEVTRTDELTTLAGDLRTRLNDPFADTLMDGALRVLLSEDNPARVHLFALAMRELMGYLLHKLAPDDEVEKCSWFKSLTPNGKPSRKQRMQYAIRGGIEASKLPDNEAIEGEFLKELMETIDELSKLTHVRPDTLVKDQHEAVEIAHRTVGDFATLVDLVHDARREFCSAIIEHVSAHTFDTFLHEVFSELDILSTHTRAEHSEVERVYVEKITHNTVFFRAEGWVEVELNYGSGGDRRRGEGASIGDSFPFQARFEADVSDFLKLKNATYEVDTSSWYE